MYIRNLYRYVSPFVIDHIYIVMAFSVVAVRNRMLSAIPELHTEADGAETRHIRINPEGNPVDMLPVLMIYLAHHLGHSIDTSKCSWPMIQLGHGSKFQGILTHAGVLLAQLHAGGIPNSLPVVQRSHIIQQYTFDRFLLQTPGLPHLLLMDTQRFMNIIRLNQVFS